MGVEECDDGNLVPNDGCGATCKLENVASAEKLAINLAIPDDKYTGPGVDPLKVACVDLPVAKAGIVATAQVTVGLDHTWVGDLVFKLLSPGNAKILTLMSRPGLVEALDDGNGTSLESSDLAKAFPILFKDGGAKDAELMGNTILNAAVVCKDDAACEYAPNPGKGPGLKFTDFAGVQSMGTWKFCVGDAAGGDLGKIDMVKLLLILQ